MSVKKSLKKDKDFQSFTKMSPPPFQTHYKNHVMQYEENNMPSKTVPNQSMKIREILDRFTKGLPISGERVPMYHGEEGIIDRSEFNRLDLTEQQEILEQARLNTQRTLERLRRKEGKQKKEEQEKIFRQKFEEELKEKEKTSGMRETGSRNENREPS